MPKILNAAVDPYSPENKQVHAGKVFVLPQSVLSAVGAVSSDGSLPSVLKDRFLLCLWDLDDGTSIWLSLQSDGDFAVTHANKRLSAGTDPNWMDPKKVTHHRDGTLWRLGGLRSPVTFSQIQQRWVTNEELHAIRARLSSAALASLVPNLKD